MQLKSSAFEDQQPIPKKYTEDGENVSPPLRWADVPEGTREFALICEDPDAPRDEPWVHWLLYRISPERREVPEGLPRDEVVAPVEDAAQGVNSFQKHNVGYRGPAPPKGHGTHHYHFRLYALDDNLPLDRRVSKGSLLNAMEGHVLAAAELVGTYER